MTGSASAFGSPGLTVSVTDNTTTTYYATATDAAGNTSACSAGVTYVEDSAAPAKPTLTATPASPSNDDTPALTGTAEAGSTVKLYTTSNCTGTARDERHRGDVRLPGPDDPPRPRRDDAADRRRRPTPPATSRPARRRWPTSRTRPRPPRRRASHAPGSPANNNSPAVKGTRRGRLDREAVRDLGLLGRVAGHGERGHVRRRRPRHHGRRRLVDDIPRHRDRRRRQHLALLGGRRLRRGLDAARRPERPGPVARLAGQQQPPKITGTAEAGSTVRVYPHGQLQRRPAAHRGGGRLRLARPRGQRLRRHPTSYSATATDAAGNVSRARGDHLRRGLDRARRALEPRHHARPRRPTTTRPRSPERPRPARRSRSTPRPTAPAPSRRPAPPPRSRRPASRSA